MQAKNLIAMIFLAFSSHVLAAGTIECTATGINKKGSTIEMEFFTKLSEANKGIADISLALDKRKARTHTIFAKNVTEFRSDETQLIIRVVDKSSKRVHFSLSYNPIKKKGSMLVDLPGASQVSSDVTCVY